MPTPSQIEAAIDRENLEHTRVVYFLQKDIQKLLQMNIEYNTVDHRLRNEMQVLQSQVDLLQLENNNLKAENENLLTTVGELEKEIDELAEEVLSHNPNYRLEE